MSKYATLLMFDGDWWEDISEAEEGDGCEFGAPYVYHGSHVLPTPESERGGSFEIGAIPAYCGKDPTRRVDFLRLGMSPTDDGDPSVTVVLDRAQVEHVRDCLTLWLHREVEEG